MSKRYVWDHITAQLTPREDGEWVRYSDLAAARAEIERLNNALTEAVNQISDLAARLGRAEGRLDASELVGVVEGWKARAEKAEAERDLARAWVAKAFRMAMNETAKGPGFIDRIRELTPADAKAALEAYGREKVREGMKRAADIAAQQSAVMPQYGDITRGYAQGRGEAAQAILAEMNKTTS